MIFEEYFGNGRITLVKHYGYEILINFSSVTLNTKAAIRTKGGVGSSELDVDGWRGLYIHHVLEQHQMTVKQLQNILRSYLPLFTSYLQVILHNNECSLLERFSAYRLTPPNENPGLKPFRVKEVSL